MSRTYRVNLPDDVANEIDSIVEDANKIPKFNSTVTEEEVIVAILRRHLALMGGDPGKIVEESLRV